MKNTKRALRRHLKICRIRRDISFYKMNNPRWQYWLEDRIYSPSGTAIPGYGFPEHYEIRAMSGSRRYHNGPPHWLKKVWSRKTRAVLRAELNRDQETAQYFGHKRITSLYDWY